VDALAGRVAVVTGASGGIGAAIATTLGAAGAHVVLAARRDAERERVAAAIRDAGGSALPVRCDVTREDDIVALFATAHEAFGRVDILINNAGVTAARAIDEMTLDYWNDIVNVNLTAAFLASREAVKRMKAQTPQGGRIVSIGSISAITPRPDSLAYTVTKHALEGLTHQLTFDGRAYGVVASIVRPGTTLTGFTAQSRPRAAAGPGERPEDYIMHAEDVAHVVLLMCTLPPEVNLYDATILPNNMKSFIGRG
jgi:NAD(P)-dependent dehydrogenase (short-subunit alcohol dehydrogenase family)